MPTSSAALLEQVTEELYARHTTNAEEAQVARREYEQRRGKVHQEDELWEPWSAAFVEWFVVERLGPDRDLPAAALSYQELAEGDPRAEVIRALVTSQRSLFEVRALGNKGAGKVEVLDLLGGAVFHVDEQRALHGVEVGDIAELRLIGLRGEVHFGRTFIYHPREARSAIVELARGQLAKGSSRRDVIDHVAQVRVQLMRYRHMSPARLYQAGSPGTRIGE